MFLLEDFREVRSIWRILQNFKRFRLHSNFGMLKSFHKTDFLCSAQFYLRGFLL